MPLRKLATAGLHCLIWWQSLTWPDRKVGCLSTLARKGIFVRTPRTTNSYCRSTGCHIRLAGKRIINSTWGDAYQSSLHLLHGSWEAAGMHNHLHSPCYGQPDHGLR